MLLLSAAAKSALLAVAFFAAPNLPGWSPPPNETDAVTWICPAHPQLTLRYSETRTENGPRYTFTEVDGTRTREIVDIDSRLSADYLGIGNLPQRIYKWIGSRLFLSVHDAGIGILDLAHARFVFNNVCEDYVPLSGDRFVVLAERAIPRHLTFDYAHYHDVLYLIDPADLHLDSPSQDPARHAARKLKLPGMLASRLQRLRNPAHLGAFYFHDAKLNFIVIDVTTLKILRTSPVPNADPAVAQAAIEEGRLDESLPSAFPEVIEKAD